MTHEERNFSRRHMFQMVGIAGAGALLTGCASSVTGAAHENQAATESAGASLTVYDPTGSTEIVNLHAPRLDTLDGKTIAFISDDAWEDDRTFSEIGRLLAEKFPNTKVITQENFIHGIDALTLENNGVPEQLKEANVDAAIVGNAG